MEIKKKQRVHKEDGVEEVVLFETFKKMQMLNFLPFEPVHF